MKKSLHGWQKVCLVFSIILVLILLFYGLQWGSRSDSPVLAEKETAGKEAPSRSRFLEGYVQHKHEPWKSQTGKDAECHVCPELSEVMKRDGSSDDRMKEFAKEREASREQFRSCRDFLREAAAAGIPNPHMSHLGDCDGDSPLHVSRNIEDVRTLLKADADPNSRNDFGATPLHYAALMYKDSEIVEALLEAGADPNLQNEVGATPLLAMKKMDSVQRSHARLLRNAEHEAEEQGSTVEEYWERHPRRKNTLDQLLKRYEDAARIEIALKGAMGLYEKTDDMMAERGRSGR